MFTNMEYLKCLQTMYFCSQKLSNLQHPVSVMKIYMQGFLSLAGINGFLLGGKTAQMALFNAERLPTPGA